MSLKVIGTVALFDGLHVITISYSLSPTVLQFCYDN